MDGQSGDDTLIGGKGDRDDAGGEIGFDTFNAEIEDQCEA